jgi:hypothetical protein
MANPPSGQTDARPIPSESDSTVGTTMAPQPTLEGVMLRYGLTMVFAQQMEASIVALAVAQTGASQPADLWDYAEELYGLTAGRLSKRLDLPDEDGDRVKRAIRGRNYLAHSFLYEVAVRPAIDGVSLKDTLSWAWTELQRLDDLLGEGQRIVRSSLPAGRVDPRLRTEAREKFLRWMEKRRP